MNSLDIESLKSRINQLVEQTKAYTVVLRGRNPEAISILANLKESLLELHNELHAPVEESSSHTLSPREMEILTLIAEGHPNKEIAYRLGISHKTVQFHIKNLFIKLSVSSRTEAVTKALKDKILSL